MVESSYYERKIKYLDLMESGERTGSAGFIKIEVKGMEISFLVNVKGLHPTDTYEREVLLQTAEGESSIGRLALKEGQGQFQYHAVMDYFRLQGIRIVLGGTREICCKWQEKQRTLTTEKSRESKKTMQENEHDSQSSQKSREIQIIPWDEVKAVEESLERVEKMMSKPEKKGAWIAAERATERTAERATERTAERATERTAERARERTAERATDGTAEGATERTAERVTERTAERATDGTAEGARERTAERARERTAERATDGTAEGARERTAEGATERAVERARERTVERATDRAAEKVTEKMEERLERRGGSTGRTEAAPVKRSIPARTLGSAKRPVRLMEDKWQQIWAIYPHTHPFHDEREYLSISPADFVLLPEEAYRAANNSFLLHGYYNYDHLILTRIEKRGEVSYYIGVPGNYYEREKQVAVMFGFESFECGTEPAQVGDFGYYMMRTQL